MAAACSALGTVLLIIIAVFCLLLIVPKLVGVKPYSVISGSMEPAISTGSLVYVKVCEPEKIKKDDVIAFYGAENQTAVITHRVVENRELTGEFITKGDANQKEDRKPIPYENLIGKVALTLPFAGDAALFFSETAGKAALVSLVLLSLVLYGAAEVIRGKPA